jgi:error-prone DNA polymerase
VTLEDETGFVNLVIWKKVAERFSGVLRDSALLAASGRVQKQGAVVHLIVHRLWEPAFESEIAPVPSYDYR